MVIDMSGGFRNADELSSMLADDLRYAAEDMGLELAQHDEAPRLFKELLYKAHKHHGRKVVVLIDEYDKPMLDNIDDTALAEQMCKQLRGFYSIIKAADKHLRFVMLTGVSKFSKVSIFSGLNNLEDISLDPQYASICGYTEDDLKEVFSEHLQGVDREQLRRWYNGYNFLGEKPSTTPTTYFTSSSAAKALASLNSIITGLKAARLLLLSICWRATRYWRIN